MSGAIVLMGQKEFGSRIGVSKQSIHQAIATGGPLYDSIIKRKINILHPLVIAYAHKRGVDVMKFPEVAGSTRIVDILVPRGGRPPTKGSKSYKGPQPIKYEPIPEVPETPEVHIPPNILEVAHLPFVDVVKMFGTDEYMIGYLKATKLLEDIEEKKLKNLETQKGVIPRDLVKKHIFSYLSANQERMLQDAPRTIVARVTALVEAGEGYEIILGTVSDIISSYLKEAKDRAKKGLRNV